MSQNDAKAAEKAAKEEAKAAEKAAKAETKEVRVINDNGQYVRTYSLEAHGKDFAKLAEEFVSTRKGYTVS